MIYQMRNRYEYTYKNAIVMQDKKDENIKTSENTASANRIQEHVLYFFPM